MATQARVMFAAKEALIDLLTEELDEQVSWSHPGKAIEKDTVIVGNIRRREQKPVSSGNMLRECSFVIEVTANTTAFEDAKTVAARTTDLAEKIEVLVQRNIELGIPELVLMAQVTGADMVDVFNDRMRETEIPLDVHVRARLPRS